MLLILWEGGLNVYGFRVSGGEHVAEGWLLLLCRIPGLAIQHVDVLGAGNSLLSLGLAIGLVVLFCVTLIFAAFLFCTGDIDHLAWVGIALRCNDGLRFVDPGRPLVQNAVGQFAVHLPALPGILVDQEIQTLLPF